MSEMGGRMLCRDQLGEFVGRARIRPRAAEARRVAA